MNWIKNSTFHTFVLHLTLLFNVCTLSVHAQENNPVIDKTGLLTIGTEDTEATLKLTSDILIELENNQEPPEDSEDSPTGLLGIKIEKNGTLEIAEGTDVGLGGSYLSIKGTLIINNLDAEKGLYGFTEKEEDGELVTTDQTINLTLDGGLINVNAVADGDPEAELDADITLGASGGTIDIAEGLSYTLGTIGLASGTAGDFKKIGNGNLIVDTVKVGGTFLIEEGKVHFSNDATVGKLMNTDSTTIISGFREDDESTTDKVEGNSMLTISKGGDIKGTLKDFSYVLVGDGSTTAKLTLEENQEHTNIGRIGITKNATLDLQAGSIQLAADPPIESEEPEPEGEGDETKDEDETKTVDYGNIIVEGTLRASDTSDGFYKGDINSPTDFVVSLIGSTNSENKVVNGIIDIYKSNTTSTEPNTIHAHDMNIQVIGLGKISVAKDLTFESGTVKFGTAGQSTVTGAHLFVDGGGTYKADEINLGTGYLLVQGEGTTVEVGGKLDAGILSTEKGTSVIAQGDAAFTQVSIAGNYNAGGKNLTIDSGGQITGNISNINALKLGKGELLLQYNPPSSESEAAGAMSTLSDTSTSMITAQSLEIDDNTQIRMVGMSTGSYSNVFQIAEEESRDKLLASLNKVQTALYNGDWSVSEAGTIDVDLKVLSVKEYVNDSWGKGGSNAANAAQMLDTLSEKFPTFGYTLAGISSETMQATLRNLQAGELTGNALQMALRPPAQSVFRHLDMTVPLRSPFSRSNMRGQIREGYNVWFTPFGQSEQADGDGATFDGYDMTRFGFHLGGDIEIYNRAVLGALFSYSSPHLKSELGKVSANDYTAGLYFRMPTAWAVVANMMVGFGNQDYSYESSYGRSEFRGGSFFFSAELARPVSFQTFRLTPLIAIDYQSAEMDDYVIFDPNTTYFLVQSSDISQTALRIGMVGNAGRFRTRIQYIRQLAGDDYGVSLTTAMGDVNVASMPGRSLEWGKDWINVGVGGELFAMRYWRIFADYNFDVGKHTTSHTGSLNTVLTW